MIDPIELADALDFWGLGSVAEDFGLIVSHDGCTITHGPRRVWVTQHGPNYAYTITIQDMVVGSGGADTLDNLAAVLTAKLKGR